VNDLCSSNLNLQEEFANTSKVIDQGDTVQVNLAHSILSEQKEKKQQPNPEPEQ